MLRVSNTPAKKPEETCCAFVCMYDAGTQVRQAQAKTVLVFTRSFLFFVLFDVMCVWVFCGTVIIGFLTL